MKKIIIVLLIIIVGFLAYDFYKDWRRLHPDNANYEASEKIDITYHDDSVLFSYYEAIEDLNSYVQYEWSVNDVDVINPSDDDIETQRAIKKYASKRALVKYLENKLENSAHLKSEGWTNDQIQQKELGITQQPQPSKVLPLYKDMLVAFPKNELKTGSRGVLVYEVQKLLNKALKDSIVVDGVYSTMTTQAVSKFESAHSLFPDGQLDALTLEKLVEVTTTSVN